MGGPAFWMVFPRRTPHPKTVRAGLGLKGSSASGLGIFRFFPQLPPLIFPGSRAGIAIYSGENPFEKEGAQPFPRHDLAVDYDLARVDGVRVLLVYRPTPEPWTLLLPTLGMAGDICCIGGGDRDRFRFRGRRNIAVHYITVYTCSGEPGAWFQGGGMDLVVALFFVFFLCNATEMPEDDQGAIFVTVLFLVFVYHIWFKKKPPPPPPPTVDKAKQELEKILKSGASVEEKKKAGVLLDHLDKLQK